MNFKTIIFKGDVRTVKAKKNILVSVALKGLDTLVYFLLVPVTLKYLNQYEYGIWLTISSILMWINSLDIGLSNGMRNKLAEAIANGDVRLGRSYVSTTFVVLLLMMVGLLILGSLINPFINWYSILNTTVSQVPNLSKIICISFILFCSNFVLKIIGTVFLAMQMPAINNLLSFLGHALSLIIIHILTLTTPGSLFWVAIIYSASPLIIYICCYPITFKKIFPYLSPSIKYFNKIYVKDIFSIGIQFFILQMSSLILFSITNVLISHLFGPEQVTPYNITYRYFSIVIIVMNLVFAPMWSATTDAYTKGEFNWIKKAIKFVRKILILVTIGICLMVILSRFIYKIWIGDEVVIPDTMTILIGTYILIIVWSTSYSIFLNGFGKLRLQTINTFCMSIAFIPLCILLGKWFGIYGMIVGMCLVNISGLILNQIQINLILTRKAKGLWNK